MRYALMGTVDRCGYGGQQKGTICDVCGLVSAPDPPSSAREERGRVWNITPGRSVPKECCARVIMTRNLAFVVSHAYKECKLRSILLKCARAQAVHAARLGTFCRPLEYSGLTHCIVANQHLSRNFCLRDTSAQSCSGPSLFSPTGGSGDESSKCCISIFGNTVLPLCASPTVGVQAGFKITRHICKMIPKVQVLKHR